MRNQNSIADLIVKGAIALVTAAFFIGAYLQFQVNFWLALIAALSVYITLLMLHAVMRRSERVDALVTEVTRLEGELARLKGQEAYAPPARGRQVRGAAMAPAAARPERRAPALSVGKAPQAEPQAAAREPQLPRASQAPHPAPQAPHRPEKQPPSEPLHDYWSFRPTKAGGPEAVPAPHGEKAALAAGERETDLEAVQGMIKRLADELSVTSDVPEPHSGQETALRATVNALHTTADTMRAATKAPAAPAGRREATPSMPPPIAPGHTRISAVAAAVADGRLDTQLESIIGLADHHVHHYELAVCPRDERGAQISLAAHEPQLARTGLNSLIDSARLVRAVQVCNSLAEGGHRNCVLTAASAESLATDRFLDELADGYRKREGLAGELVLTFSQTEVKAFGGTEWRSLTDMRDLGFRFGLENVIDFDYEFSALAAAGFAFVKIDATRFLKGLSGPDGVTSPADIVRELSDLGLAVVASGIADEATRTAIVDSGVPLGEGALFGAPRTISVDVPAGSGTAAA